MSPESTLFILAVSMPAAALLYSSVGHGGASSYLALLTIFGFLPAEVRPAALLLNIGVSGIAFISFRQTCKLPRKLFMQLIFYSMPAAFVGGTLVIDASIYQKLLGILLIFPVLRLFNVLKVKETAPLPRKQWMAPALGLVIGFASGVAGIGGGILLSPVLILMGWANLKETAAISALFILLNSISGLAGMGLNGIALPANFEILLPLTLAGGITGGYLGAHKYNAPAMKYALATVLLIASFKFLI